MTYRSSRTMSSSSDTPQHNLESISRPHTLLNMIKNPYKTLKNITTTDPKPLLPPQIPEHHVATTPTTKQ
jgi:hypothetical protein